MSVTRDEVTCLPEHLMERALPCRVIKSARAKQINTRESLWTLNHMHRFVSELFPIRMVPSKIRS